MLNYIICRFVRFFIMCFAQCFYVQFEVINSLQTCYSTESFCKSFTEENVVRIQSFTVKTALPVTYAFVKLFVKLSTAFCS